MTREPTHALLGQSRSLDEPRNLTRDFGSRTHLVAAELRRLSNAAIGVDRWHKDLFAIYFYDQDDNEIRSAGRFVNTAEAAFAVSLIRAEAVLEALDAEEAQDG